MCNNPDTGLEIGNFCGLDAIDCMWEKGNTTGSRLSANDRELFTKSPDRLSEMLHLPHYLRVRGVTQTAFSIVRR